MATANPALRVVAVLVAAVTTFYFVQWVPLAFVEFRQVPWLVPVLSACAALAAGWYVWRRLGPGAEGLLPTAFLWSAVAGTVGFVGGFCGPLVFAPDANQGPLLGILITGPLGFVVGGIAGCIRAAWQQSQSPPESRRP